MGLAKDRTGYRRVAILLSFLMMFGTILTFGGPAIASHPDGSCLDVEDETPSNPVGTTHTLTASLHDQPLPATSCSGAPSSSAAMAGAGGVEVRFEVESGPVITVVEDDTAPATRTVTPQNGNPSTEDMSCTIPEGEQECIVVFSATQVGTNVIRGWIADGTIDETEPRDETEEEFPNDPEGNEADETDVVQKTWTALAASRLDCNPETDTNATGDAHTVTCTATDQFGNAVAGESVDAEASGANDPDNADGGTRDFSCSSTTNAQGQCSFIHGPGGTGSTSNEGTTTYRAFLDNDGTSDNQEGDLTETRAPDDADDTDTVEKTWVHAPLNCGPETDVNPTGTAHTITCTARNSQGQLASGIFIDMEAFGANPVDPTTGTVGDSPGSPDFSCTTDANGQCSMIHGPGGRGTTNDFGTTTYRAWVDEDNNNATYEGDQTEGPNSGGEGDAPPSSPSPSPSPTTQAGATAEPDKTDVVTKDWTASRLDCNPETDTNPAGSAHVVTCIAQGQSGNLASNVEIHIEATGANDPDGTESFDSPDFVCITNAQGRCTITHGTGGTGTTDDGGTTVYTAWIDVDAPGSQDDNTVEADQDEGRAEGTDQTEPDNTDVVEKTWIASRLDCSPETDTNPAQTAHTVTCTATDTQGVGQSGMAVDAEATGVNDPDSGNTPQSPDFTCVTGTTGQCSFTHGPGGRGTTTGFGQTLYRAWIDADGNDATAEADPSEGRNEGVSTTSSPSPSGSATTSPSPSPSGSPTTSPSPSPSASGTPGPQTGAGTRAEPDDTDVVEKNWSAVPSSLRIDPETDSAPVGSCNAFTVTALNASGQPVQGVVVDLEQRHERSDNTTANDEPTVAFCTPSESDGSNPSAVDATRGDLDTGEDGTIGGEAEDTTDQAGKVTIGIRVSPGQGSNGTGNVLVTAFYENEDNDDADSGDPQDTATKTWTPSQARTIDCEPEDASNRVGTEHIVTCIVRDANGDPVEGEGVTFTEDGPGTLEGPTQSNTDENGQATATATATSDETGTQTITGAVTASTEGEPDTDECDRAANDPQGAPAGACSDTVEKTWRPGQRVRSGPCRGFNEGTRTDRSGGGQVIVGTDGPDTLRGTGRSDIICGLGGRDTLIGRGGGDRLSGGGGNDDVRGNAGRDRAQGNGGRDVLTGAGGNDRLNGGAKNDRLVGGAGDDTLNGAGGDDVLRGGGDNDTLNGGGGDDTLNGGDGRDTFDGGRGTDNCAATPPEREENCER